MWLLNGGDHMGRFDCTILIFILIWFMQDKQIIWMTMIVIYVVLFLVAWPVSDSRKRLA